MALINCPECGKEISDTAKSCPECGYNFQKQKTKNGAKKLLTILIPVIAIAAIVIGVIIASKNAKQDNPFENITLSTTKEDLSAIYGSPDFNGVWDGVMFCGLEGQMMRLDIGDSTEVDWWYEFDEPLSNSEIEKQYGKNLKNMRKEAQRVMAGEEKIDGDTAWYYSADKKSYIVISPNKRTIMVTFGPSIN